MVTLYGKIEVDSFGIESGEKVTVCVKFDKCFSVEAEEAVSVISFISSSLCILMDFID